MPSTAHTSVEFSQQGAIDPVAATTARNKVTRVTDRCRERVDRIEIRLTLESDPARERPAIAEATLDIDGTPVRAQVAAPTIDEAIDLLVDRLRRRVERHEDRRHRLHTRGRTGDSGAGQWRRGDIAVEPEFIDVPFDEREVRRHKTFALEPLTLEEAVFDLDVSGHEFYLFVDQATGADCVVRRTSEGEIALITMDPERARERPDLGDLAVDPVIPLHLTLIEAKEQLEVSGGRFLFHLAGDPERGRVLYRRFDGHYGLVTPS